jgi:hypothetical protein
MLRRCMTGGGVGALVAEERQRCELVCWPSIDAVHRNPPQVPGSCAKVESHQHPVAPHYGALPTAILLEWLASYDRSNE